MPLPFNKNLDLKLLKLVKENPILFNTKHSKYLDFDSREVVWQKIGDSLGRPAAEFAGIQCQIHFGDFQEKKHKPGFIENLEEYLPEQYSNAWGVEKKILKAYSQHQGVSQLDAKYLYIKTARELPTYGVTFFLVKEKQKDKKKLVPRLLGINSESILRLDEVTKEILQQWPLTHVKTYHAGKSETFTLNFGDYSDKEYSVKTQDAHRIRDILEGYIDIIRRRMLGKPHADPGESMTICHDNVQFGRGHIIEHVSNNPSKIVTETFVGPTRILPCDQGSQAQQGTQLMTVQQIVVTDHLQKQQQALKGEVPVRGDMPIDCVRKLNRMNSNSVKIVTLLTDPTEDNVNDSQKIVESMQEDLPVVNKGVKETAEKQAVEEAKKMLLDELQDLNNYMNKLSGSTKPGHVNPNDAKEAAECIADLTTQMYFSIDPSIRRRSDMLRHSRKSFKAGEKTEQTIRRASFIASATCALHATDCAAQALHEEYKGPKVDEAERKRLERSLEDRMGKLNAAIALYLTAHSDPENIDYSAAINSMNAINELMPKLARDAQILGSTREPAARKELQDDMRTLFDATKKVCGLTGTDDHGKMQEASNNYADIAGKLIFTFARGTNADKENEIIALAKDAGDKTSLLLVTANELTCQASDQPAAADVDHAGVRTAGAARDLLACAQLTAPAIHEPHCQSALTAAAEGLASSVHQMEATWRPLVEDPTRQHMSDQLHNRAIDVNKALERLKDAYAHLGADDEADTPQQDRQRLKFIATNSAARDMLEGVEELWHMSGSDKPSDQDKVQAQRRLEQQMAQLNAAIAALASATADRENPDYATAEVAVSTISELLPQIVKDMDLVSSDKDEATRAAMLNNVRALCDATRAICNGDGTKSPQEVASDYADASGKLVFLISPGADKGKQRQMMELSSSACGASEGVVSLVRLLSQAAPGAPAELQARTARARAAADGLLAVAQVTAPSIGEARCQNQLASASEKLRKAIAELTASCYPQLQRPEEQQQLLSSQQQFDDSLDKLLQACQAGHGDNMGDEPSAQQEKQRLKFISSVSGAKNRLDAAELQLNQPMVSQKMKQEDGAALEHKLSQRLAQLNAAIAALAAATADRENPDYAAADRAVNTITELMPHVVQDSRKLCGTKNDAGQAAMLQDLKALCEATREICDNAGQPQTLGEAAAKFSAASGKMVFLISPKADDAQEQKILNLSAVTCGKASELLAQVQQLTEQLEPAAAAELDTRGAKTADAAQALLTVAQLTVPSISEPACSAELVSAAEKLRGSAANLSASCRPHLQQRPEELQRVTTTHQQLGDSLDKLVHACRAGQRDTMVVDPAQQEKQRLKFISSVSGAKNRLDAAEQQLNQPMVSQKMKQEDGAALEHKLSQRLAQLNAAIAALAAATADRENPDYAAADRAVNTITELMPHVVQDSRKLCGTKNDAGQAAMLQDLKALCEATREICDNAGQPQTLGEAAAKFSAASGKMVFLISPKADDAQEQKILNLSAVTCGKASELLAQVQQLTEQLEPAAAAELDTRGAKTADAAQALLTVAQLTVPSISEPACSAELVSAAEKLRGSAANLSASCRPHLQQRPEELQRVTTTHQQLGDSLDKLVHACRAGQRDTMVVDPAQQEKQRLKFISSVSGAKNRLDAAEQQLNQPMVSQKMKQEDGAALEHKLSQRLAQLNAAIAALAAATADRENPDYAAADRAVNTITELMPHVVQVSRKLCGTKNDAGQAAMLQDLKALCEATREICDNAGQPQALGEAAAKFSAASGKMVFLISPKADDAQEQKILNLSAVTCGKTSELLAQVQQLTEQLEPVAAAELDTRGAKTADAAQALLTVAQLTVPSISEPACSAELVSAAEKLRGSAANLSASCRPHLQQRPEELQRVTTTHQQLGDSLDKLVHACRAGQRDTMVVDPAQQEKQRLKFISSVSGAKKRLDAAEQQLNQPMVSQKMKQEDGAALEHKLSQRLAQLNAAIAALAAATADRENPDYAAADRAVNTITELMPHVVQDSRKLCGTKNDAGQAAMLQDLKALCEATREICDNAGQPQTLGEAAAKFSAASGKMVFLISPKADDAQEQKILNLSAATCGKASELLAQVQQLTEQLEPAAAAELDTRGAKTADAAQVLLTVAQLTVPSISEPACSAELVSAAEKLRGSAADLSASCRPHLQQRPEELQRVTTTHQQLGDSLDKLVHACRAGPVERTRIITPSDVSAQQEKQRLKFVSGVSGAKNRLYDAEQQLKQPMVCQMMRQEDGAALEHKLSQRLAQLNAAIAALAAATADRENPDYVAADLAVKDISELMPQVVQDSRKLCGTKNDAGQAAMLQELRALCEATRDICDNAGQSQGLSDAAAKYSVAAGKMVFLLNPETDNAQEKQVINLSSAACGKALELLAQVQQLTEQLEPAAAAELDMSGARTADAAQALLIVAQVAGRSISSSSCAGALTSAAVRLRNCAADVTVACGPQLQQAHLQQHVHLQQQVMTTYQHLEHTLNKLLHACKPGQVGNLGDASSAQQEKQRLEFISSVSGAKNRLDAVEQQLNQPMVCQKMKQEDGAALEHKLSQRLALLNAAVAALAAATADRENPDYTAAERAVRTITELMPHVVQDSRALCGTKDDAGQTAMVQELRALCEASRHLCNSAGQPQGLGDAAAEFSAASGKLVFLVSPKAHDAQEKQVLDLSAVACGKMSELLAEVQQLTEQLEPAAADELDTRCSRTADAAQTLLTVAQVTAPSISEPACSAELVSAAEKLRGSAADLSASCRPHLQQRPEELQRVTTTHQQLGDSLDKLVHACRAGQRGTMVVDPAQQEKQRLKFISSVSGAKNRLDAAEQQLNQPMVSQKMKQEDGAALEHKLSQRLAQLNAAIAALAAATADRENPDYAAADRAVNTITELMPHVVQDSRKLCGTKNDAGQAAMLQDLKALCEATREICDNAGQPQALGEAAAKFSAASGKMVFLISPKADDAQEQKILNLSAVTCGKASELLAQVQQLTEQLEPAAAAELDTRGAKTADAAQVLLTVAQLTVPSISEPACSTELVSAAEKLRGSAADLSASCRPHLQQRPEELQRVTTTHQQLGDSLDKLVHACRAGQRGTMVIDPAQQEKQRLKFISSVSGAKNRLDAAEQQLNQPMVCVMKQEDGAALEHKLSQRLAQLNAAIAALAAATADRENPDYAAADRAVNTITELMPHVVQDSRKLCGTKNDAGQAAMLQDLKALCEATREICDNAGQPQALGEAAAKFSAASGKMVFFISPKADDAQEQKVLNLSAVTCGKASELLAQVQQLTEQLEPAAAAELDTRGAKTADAAQALLTVAQLTVPSISEPACSAELVSAAEKLRGSAADLSASCRPHLQQRPEELQRVTTTHQQLGYSLDKLIHACQEQYGTDATLSPQQETQRLKFVSTVAGVKTNLDAVEQQMKQPLVHQPMKQEDGAQLQHQLSRRLAQLNAAIAALAAATSDGKHPDYPAAERAVTTITELMPQVVQDSRALCGTKDDAGQAAMSQELRALCAASRAICNSAGQPRKLHEASAKLAEASGRLVFLVSAGPRDAPTRPIPGKKPTVPARDPSTHSGAHAAHAPDSTCDVTHDFKDRLREETHGDKATIVSKNIKSPTAKTVDDDKLVYNQFSQVVDTAEQELKIAEDGLKALYSSKRQSTPGVSSALQVCSREQHMEDTLARAAVEVATLVAANYADKLDYKAAMEPTIALTKSVKTVVDDGSVISSSLDENARKLLINDIRGLCEATKDICEAARSNKEKLNDAAISFGNQSAKLLRVVSSDVNPTLEKEVISRAKAIGDTASRLALEASNVASDTSNKGGDTHVQDICTAGARCVDAAGKLVYTAKLIAPTIHHSTCQDALVSSSDSLSSSLTTFFDTWKPLASAQSPNVQKLTEEAGNLEELVEKLRKDIRAGKLGRRREVDRLIDVDTPLRKMTMQIIENTKNMAEHGDLTPELKKEYTEYSSRLGHAVRALDLANARYQRAAHDKNKRGEMEMAIQDLQMMLLQSMPSRAGQEQNNIVDFRDFLQDLTKEADQLQEAAKRNEIAVGKRATDDIKLLCSKISEDANRLLNPTDHQGDGMTVMTSVDDVMDIDQFGQECDVLVKEINNTIKSIQDQKAKQELRAKALLMNESCNLLRFATNSHISATRSAAFEEALQDLDNFQMNVIKPLANDVIRKKTEDKKVYTSPLGSSACARRARAQLLQAARRAAGGEPQALCPALASYSAAACACAPTAAQDLDTTLTHLEYLTEAVQMTTGAGCQLYSNWEYCPSELRTEAILKEIMELDKLTTNKPELQLLSAEDIDKLLLCEKREVEGTQKQLEDKVHQLSTKLSSMSGTIMLSVKKPESLTRSAHAATDVAVQLANTARALKDPRKPVQCKRIEDAAHDMCLATYNLLKTSELVCQDPKHHDSRRKLLDACRQLNDSINKLVRRVNPVGKVAQECGEVHRSLQLQRSVLQAAPQPCGAMPYAHCVDTLHSQRDVIQKLKTDQAMSREEFLKSMQYVASAVSNSTDCAAHAAYLLSASEKDESMGKEGLVDVSKLHKAVGAVQDTCVAIITAQQEEQIQDEKKTLEGEVQELLESLNDSITKTKDGDLRDMLKHCREDVDSSARTFFIAVNQKKPKEATMPLIMNLMNDVNNAANLIEHPHLVPSVDDVSADTQAKSDEVVKSSLALLTNTEELIKQVKSAPDQPEMMTWVMFHKRKDVLDAFEALLKSMKSNGQRAKFLEVETEDSEEQKKSYVQKQFDAASRWLLKPSVKADVKSNGQQAVRNLIDVANKITEDLKGHDKEDMRHLIMETEQVLTECTKKYDHEQYSVLMERVRELKKGIERGVVTRVVEDFMEAEAPLADLDILAEHERDETKRKFLLEKKIAELLAHLSRVTKTARLIAHTDSDTRDTVSTQLDTCSEQAELLAPILVKAAQQRVASPDDKVVIDNYKSLLARYAESLSKIRDLCDQSVDPMDFVQTAGETMQRMRDESTKHNDPMKCAHTTAAITKLANRVIHVGLSSSTARQDPELQQALAHAQLQLSAATPPADTRASRLPDWKDTTAQSLRATEEVESLLGGETIFKKQPEPNQPIYNEALNLHVAIRDWSSRDNEIVAVAKRMAVLMAKLSNFMNNDKQREVLATSKSIVTESHEVARLAKKLAHECTDHRIKTNLLQVCERIPTISGQLKMLTTVKGFSLGRHGTQEDKEAMDMLVGNAQSLMLSIHDVVKGAASASVKIMSQRGRRMKWVRKTIY